MSPDNDRRLCPSRLVASDGSARVRRIFLRQNVVDHPLQGREIILDNRPNQVYFDPKVAVDEDAFDEIAETWPAAAFSS